jgi:hypothetical protein
VGNISDYVNNKMVDHVLRGAPCPTFGSVYLALSTTAPASDGSGVSEPSGNAYARTLLSFGAPASRQIVNSANVEFPKATGPWGEITHWAIFDSLSGGNFLAFGDFGASRDVILNNRPIVGLGTIPIGYNSGKISDYLAHAILNHVFRNVEFTQPSTVCVALVENTEIADADTGATIDELDMTGYAREPHADWNGASGGASNNDGIITFGSLTDLGETAVAVCLTDNATKGAGNVLFYDNTPNQPIADGDVVQFPSGSYGVSLT